FLNTLLLRTELAGCADFGGLLARVRSTCLDAFAHQDLPLEQVLAAAFPDRDPGRGSPFQVMFLLQNLAPVRDEAPGLAFLEFSPERRSEALGTAMFELGLPLYEPLPGQLQAPLQASTTYNALLFDAATIERLLAHYELLLAAVVEDPARGLWEYPLL